MVQYIRRIEFTEAVKRRLIDEMKDATAKIFDLEERLRPSRDASERQNVLAPIAVRGPYLSLRTFRPRAFTVADLVDLLEQDAKEDRLKQRLAALCKPKLLILDEMGYIPLDQRSAQLLFRLISSRYQKGSIILTSNKSYGEWGNVVSE